MWEIPVYAAEKKDGLAELVRANASVAYTMPARVLPPENQEKVKAYLEGFSSATNKGQFDLFYLDTILVTTGWNKNDDIFLKEPTWAARHTAEDKPFNFGHNQLEIIGHITANSVVDEEYKTVADDSVLEDVPDKFHILTPSVIYKTWADKDQQKKIDKIVAEILEDKWYVSMECLFKGFGYGLTTAKGEQKLIARSEETAFLTKHLRSYGGTGQYQDYKIGRALMNITFSGKGLVENPANPESIIFNNVATFRTTFGNMGYINSSDRNVNPVGETSMADTSDKNVDLQKALDLAHSTIAKLNEKLEQRETQAAKASEEKINSLTAAVEDEKKKAKKAEDDTKAALESVDSVKKELAEVKKELEDTKAASDSEKKTFEAYKKKAKVKAAGASDEEVNAFLEDWGGVSEAQFDKALNLAKNSFKTNADSGSLDKPDNVKKVATMKQGSDDAVNRVNADKVLDDTQTPPTGTAASANVNENVETTRAKLSDFLGKSMTNAKSRKR